MRMVDVVQQRPSAALFEGLYLFFLLLSPGLTPGATVCRSFGAGWMLSLTVHLDNANNRAIVRLLHSSGSKKYVSKAASS